MSDKPLDKCKHFNGTQNQCCKAGVSYGSVSRPLPCLQFSHQPTITGECQKRELMTAEEHAARQREVDEAVARTLSAWRDGKCHTCGADIEPSRMIGRCKYGACGHRIGQVA